MKRLQTTQKRAYTSPGMEVLETENDMPLLAGSKVGLRDMQNSSSGGLGNEDTPTTPEEYDPENP